MKRGLLLFAHGARDPRWAMPFEDLARRVRALDRATEVQLSFLEFMAPTLHEGGERLVAAGCTVVDVIPLFLGTGGHVRKDLPGLLDALAAEHGFVHWRLRAAIGEVDSVVQAMAEAALALADSPSEPDEST
jgi:sirohydrochlorin cobaltochelatase